MYILRKDHYFFQESSPICVIFQNLMDNNFRTKYFYRKKTQKEYQLWMKVQRHLKMKVNLNKSKN